MEYLSERVVLFLIAIWYFWDAVFHGEGIRIAWKRFRGIASDKENPWA